MNDMIKQILNEAFQHVTCLRYRYQKEAPWIHQKHRIRTTKFQIIDPIIIPIKVYYLSIWILGNIVIYLILGIPQPPPQRPQFLYLNSIGWKTAKPHRIEIWFVEHDKKYYNPNVSFNVNNKSFEGYARVIDDKELKLISNVSRLMNRKYGWSDGLIVELNPQ